MSRTHARMHARPGLIAVKLAFGRHPSHLGAAVCDPTALFPVCRSLWNVCSLNATALGKFAFMAVRTPVTATVPRWAAARLRRAAVPRSRLVHARVQVDTDGSNVLDLEEVRELVASMTPPSGMTVDFDDQIARVWRHTPVVVVAVSVRAVTAVALDATFSAVPWLVAGDAGHGRGR